MIQALLAYVLVGLAAVWLVRSLAPKAVWAAVRRGVSASRSAPTHADGKADCACGGDCDR